MKIRYIVATLAITFLITEANAQFKLPPMDFGPEDIEKGVKCDIKNVALLAKNEDACKQAGGMPIKAENKKDVAPKQGTQR